MSVTDQNMSAVPAGEAVGETAMKEWADVPGLNCRAAEAVLADGTRAVIVESDARAARDTKRTATRHWDKARIG